MAAPFQNDAARTRKRYVRSQKKKGEAHIGPDGPRRLQGIVDTGRGLGGTQKQRNNPKPKRITAGPRLNRNRPQRHSQPRRQPFVDPYASQVNSLAELQYGPQQRELAYQGQVEAQRGVNTQNWYQQYQQAVQQAQRDQAIFSQGFQQAAYQQANQAAATDQAQNQQLLAQQQEQANLRGMNVDPSVAQNMQAGVAARQAMGTAGGNLLAQQGQAQTAYLGNRVGVAHQQGIQAGADVQARQRKVESLARELLADKGAFKVKAGQELRDTAHKQRLEEQAFGLDVAQERFDQRDALADNRRMSQSERRQQREARSRIRDRRADNYRADRSQSLAERKEQRMRDQDLADDGRLNGSSGGKSGGSFTPTQVRSGRKELRNLIGRVKNNVDPPDSVDPLLARAAVQIADNGGVSPDLARKIKRQYGFTPKIKRTSWQKKAGDKGRRAAQDFF